MNDSTTTNIDKQQEQQQVASSSSLLLETSMEDALLEQTVDTCVACMDNVDAQHAYESALEQHDSHLLSAAEASQIRLDAGMQAQSTTLGGFDLEDFNLCGTDDLDDVKTTIEHSLHTTKNKNRPSSPTLHCAICLDDVQSFQQTTTTFCDFPCCQEATTRVCTACMFLLSSPTTSGESRIGHCPTCRSWLCVQDGGLTITPVLSSSTDATCRICNQNREFLVDNDVCDACFLGRTFPLFYECKECRHPQCIPHPMYRYQSLPEEFGNVSWACQGPCQNFTTWRIIPEYIPRIPPGDVPTEWGRDYWKMARVQVMEARRNMRDLQQENGGGMFSGCVIQ